MRMIPEKKYCSPLCPFFRCAKKALKIINRKPMCLLTADECDPKNCNFVICLANKYLPGGVCGKEIRRITRPIEFKEEALISKDRIRGKLKEFKDEFL